MTRSLRQDGEPTVPEPTQRKPRRPALRDVDAEGTPPPGRTERKARPVGLRDVAARAGVSMGTVSNVLNRPDSVRPANRERVERAIRELNFIGSYAAVALRQGRSALIGVVVPDVGNPFWGDVLRGIESVADRRNVLLTVTSTHQDLGRERKALSSFLSRQLDGVVVVPLSDENPALLTFIDRGIPAVALDRRLRQGDVPSVDCDDVAGGRAIAEHLIGLGHDHIVLVNGRESISWSRDRRAGMEEALRLHSEVWFREVVVPDLTAADGLSAVPELIRLLPKGGAIVGGNDLVALGILRGLRGANRLVPAEYSLVGYDDVEFAGLLAPALTTVRQKPFEMGRAAAEMLFQGHQEETSHITFEPELVVRESTLSSRP